MSQAQRDLEELQRRQIADAIGFVMGDPRGRLFVRMVMAMTLLDSSPMTGNSQTFHNLGAQSVGRALRDRLRSASLVDWRLMEDEDIKAANLMRAARQLND